MRKLIEAAGLLVLLTAGPALAHHGWSTYDPAKVLTFEGPVQQSSYEFPHGELVLEAEGRRWTVVLAPPSRMGARGLPAADIAVGTTVKVVGYPLKNGEPEMRAERITVGGRTVELR